MTRFTEFVPRDGGKRRTVTSLRLMYLRESLGVREAGAVLAASEVEVFAAGTTDLPFQFAGNAHTTLYASKNYGAYVDWMKDQSNEWSVVKLPSVKDQNQASVEGITFQDVKGIAAKAEVRIKIGKAGQVFKNVPLE